MLFFFVLDLDFNCLLEWLLNSTPDSVRRLFTAVLLIPSSLDIALVEKPFSYNSAAFLEIPCFVK